MTVLWALQGIALLLVAVWFRCRSLGNLPGINGDEAWYGLRALEIIGGQPFPYSTPTGNPLNPFFLGPVTLLHAWFGPSVTLLRSVAVASGLMALALNWLLCRWIYGRTTAAICTICLAVLPINIAYSRFAWDSSQSLLATLPVVYFALAAIRFPQRRGWFTAAAILSEAVAMLVHPANIFAAAVPAAALASYLRWSDIRRLGDRYASARWIALVLALALIPIVMGCTYWLRSAGPSVVTSRLVGVKTIVQEQGFVHFAVLYPRLFTGGTVYGYLAGSRSWLEWPYGELAAGGGIDVLLFWIVLAAAVVTLWRSQKNENRAEDRVLVVTWALSVIGFLLVAGPPALVPGYERYGICLIAPTILLLARGMATMLQSAAGTGRLMLGAAALSGWLLLADCQTHYFAYIERTGGCAHRTFRTAAEEPKQTAVNLILAQREPGTTWILSSAYWNELPLRYLAWPAPEVRVVGSEQAEGSPEIATALAEGRVWYVEFTGSKELQQVRSALADRELHEWQIKDYGDRPLLSIVHAAAER
jgi:hypothetical protein